MAKDKVTAQGSKAFKAGDRVKVVAGDHEGKEGVFKHHRPATDTAHVEQDSGKMIFPKLSELAAV